MTKCANPNCDNEVTGRRKTCSGKCRTALCRAKAADSPGQSVTQALQSVTSVPDKAATNIDIEALFARLEHVIDNKMDNFLMRLNQQSRPLPAAAIADSGGMKPIAGSDRQFALPPDDDDLMDLLEVKQASPDTSGKAARNLINAMLAL